MEGIFCEPSSAASVAGVTKLARVGELDPELLVVCVLTGGGLKDPDTAERTAIGRVVETGAAADDVRRAIGW